jgi:hypothetical protein
MFFAAKRVRGFDCPEERIGEERGEERRGKRSRRTGSSVNGDVVINWRNLRTRTGHV